VESKKGKVIIGRSELERYTGLATLEESPGGCKYQRILVSETYT